MVSPAAASKFTITAPATTTPFQKFSITVTAYDPYNNVASGYTGTVHFTTTCPSYILPPNY